MRATVAKSLLLQQVRTKTTSIIPPNISSLRELGKLQSTLPYAHPERFAKIKHFYKVVPKGPASEQPATTFGQRYYKKYIAGNSAVPLLHFIAVMVPVGYYIAYFKGGVSRVLSFYCIVFINCDYI
jgi:Mitochondrial F1-F0 ATP synthase subunit F of fungi